MIAYRNASATHAGFVDLRLDGREWRAELPPGCALGVPERAEVEKHSPAIQLAEREPSPAIQEPAG